MDNTSNVMSLARRVLAKWRAVGVDRPDDVGRAETLLSEIERAHAIVLPETFRELWSLSDGTAAMDDDELTFWPLDNISSDPSLGPWRGLLVFADHLVGSHHYALRFDAERAQDVVLVTGETVAPSFDVFLERYLEKPSSLVVRGR